MTESGESLASMGNSCDSSFLKLVGSMDAPLSIVLYSYYGFLKKNLHLFKKKKNQLIKLSNNNNKTQLKNSQKT